MTIRVFATLVSAVAVLAALSPVSISAQGAAPAASSSVGHNIAIVDVGVIFTGCTRYKAAIETMKQQTMTLENQFKAEYETMKKVNDEMKVMQPGSPEFRKKEGELAKMELDFKYRQAQARKDFEERVNGVQFQLYREIDAVVKQISVRNNISLVLRHNTTMPDGRDPNQVLRAINQAVVYYNPSLDVTQLVLGVLNQNTTPLTPGGNVANVPARPVPAGGNTMPR